VGRKTLDEIKEPIWQQLALNFSTNVTYFRQRKGLTQAELAKSTNLNVATIADIEQKTALNPRLETIAVLMKGLCPTDPLALLKKTPRL
jgi:transcriptional regulator with XRE-family HTH domain